MRVISGPHVHAEIVGLLDRAQRFVVLVSPFVRPWPELRMALGRAVGRGVRVDLYTRGGRGGPTDEDLRVFYDLDVHARRARQIHQKLYLSESEALLVSANLTGDAVGRAQEGGMHAARDHDREAWLAAAELWLQTRDMWTRDKEEPESEVDVALLVAEGKEPPPDGHCVTCARPLRGDDVRCLPCRAGSVAMDRDPDELPWRFCPECGAPWAGSDERPLCGTCFRASEAVRPASWWVSSEAGSVDAWWVADPASGQVSDAIANRIALRFPDGGTLCADLSRTSRARFDAFDAALPFRPETHRSVFIERRPPAPGPIPAALGHLPPADVNHVVYRHATSSPDSAWWLPDRTLTTFAVALPPRPSPVRAPMEWFWTVFLNIRPKGGAEALDPDRTLLWLDLHVTLPEAEVDSWWGHTRTLRELVLQALHPADAELAALLVRTLPEELRGPALARIREPGLLTPIPAVRRKGQPVDLGARPDRVAVTRLSVEVGERREVRGSVRTVKRRPVS